MNHNTAFCRLAILPALLIPILSTYHPAQAAPRVSKAKTGKKAVASKPAASKPVASKAIVPASIVNMPLVKLTDPNEHAFTVSAPKGWRNQAYLARTYELHRSVITSLSPDNKTLLFVGDPRLPNYMLPTPQMQQIAAMMPLNPLAQLSPLIPAKEYFPWYVKQKFGMLPGFRLTNVAPHPTMLADLKNQARQRGMNSQLDAAKVAFSYTEKGKPMRAIVNGYTLAQDTIWIVGVSGVSTQGDPEPYNKLVLRIANTYRTDPRWKEQQQQLHEQRMAMLRNDAQNNQLALNASNQRHQMRMNAIKDAGNASMKSWYQNQASSDATHRSFMNYITDEHTVVDGSGRSFQVDNSHQRYFVNKNDNSYIGTSNTTSLDDLRAMGLNPNDYQQAKIRR